MSEVKPAAEIMKELKKKYDQNRKNWQVMAGRDSKGRHDIFFLHEDNLWQLKMENVKPNQYVGYGARMGKLDIQDIPNLGIGKPMIFELIAPQINGSLIIAKGVEKYSSENLRDLKAALSSGQNKLELKLSEELDRLIRKYYPELQAYV